MRELQQIKNNPRLRIIREGADGFQATLTHSSYKNSDPIIVFSWGANWQHASFSFKNRCPSWDEMCMIKDIFWGDEECVVQYHPPKSQYVNNHPYCLHLWLKTGYPFETPPKILVGV